MNSQLSSARNKRLTYILLTATCLLLWPLIAMQFSTGVKWSVFDFMIAGVLLYGTGLACELVLRKVQQPKYRFLLCGLILIALFLIWAELAVGIFGTPLECS